MVSSVGVLLVLTQLPVTGPRLEEGGLGEAQESQEKEDLSHRAGEGMSWLGETEQWWK